MTDWKKTPFVSLLIDSKDGEWGLDRASAGFRETLIIRGTDFPDLNNPSAEFPRRWVKDSIVERKQLRACDLILETAGGTSTQSTGRSALLTKSFINHHADLPVLCASFSRYLRFHTGKYSPYFIYYLLQGLYRSGYMSVFNTQHTGVSRFQYTAFKKHTELRVPRRSIQQKIAAILSAYDELIENNKRRIALLEKLAKELYREWFVRFRFPGHERAKVVKGIPNGWKVRTLGSFADEIRRGVKKKNLADDENYVGLEHIPRRSIVLRTWTTADTVESDKLLFRERDILFGKIRPYLHKVAIAHFSGACSSDTIVLRPKEKCYEGYLLFTVFSDTFIELATVASKGTKMPRADWGFLKRLELIVPNEQLLERYQAQFNVVFRQIANLLSSNRLLSTSRDLLLPRLISGKLSVENLDIQFPPEMIEELGQNSNTTHHA